MRQRQPPEPIKLNRFASRIALLAEVPYDHVSRTIKAMLILMAQMPKQELALLLGRYKKFQGNVPSHLDKIHE